ncbi:MAG: M48 family metallopeptidase [Candidatus Omnitrophica bacterium]|nr:M48 family metallopeptidase [Candidatus Omnitrophota bacterium]
MAIERQISALQAREFQRQGARPVRSGERLYGLNLQDVTERISQVTERPTLHYQVWLAHDQQPNAAALADGRVFITTGMLHYLAQRGSREEELACIIGHEIGHTVAQHLVQRVVQLQRQQMVLGLVSMGASLAAAQGGAPAQAIGGLASDVASLITDAVNSQYSQSQELEADQLGVRYMLRSGYDPWAAPQFLRAFSRFDAPGGFLRTHPYSERRAEDLERYLVESGVPRSAAPAPTISSPSADERIRRLREAQRLYAPGSQSWKNLQAQIDALTPSRFSK